MASKVLLTRHFSPFLTDTIGSFIDSLKDYPVLTNEEMMELFREMKKGGPNAKEIRDKLICCNARLAYHVTCYFATPELKHLVEDINSVAIIAIINAIDNFDPDMGCTFSTYAIPCCHGNVISYLNANRNLIYLPTRKHVLLNKIMLYIDELRLNNHEIPSLSELSKTFNVSIDELTNMLAAQKMISLDSPIDDGTCESGSLMSLIPDNSIVSPEQACINKNLLECSNVTLTEFQIDIAMKALGIEPYTPARSFAEIAEEYGCSRQYIFEIYQRTIKKLKNSKTYVES